VGNGFDFYNFILYVSS